MAFLTCEPRIEVPESFFLFQMQILDDRGGRSPLQFLCGERPPRPSTRDPPAASRARHTRAPFHSAARPLMPPRGLPAAPARHTRAPSHSAARPPAPPRGPPAAPARHGRAPHHPP
eukprot:scaffold1538_cov70-Phaeocystis_antarctica.AAC.3